MWCPSCRADVAAELSTDNRRMLCARCQSELGIAAAALPRISSTPRTAEAERDARELLARWSTQNLLDVSSPIRIDATSSFTKATSESNMVPTRQRIDPPQASVPAPSTATLAALHENRYSPANVPPTAPRLATPLEPAVDQVQPRRQRSNPSPDRVEQTVPMSPSTNGQALTDPLRRLDANQEHDQLVRDALHSHATSRTGWTTLAGQLCAYGGVGLLTCGTVLVMWSYFGGPVNYMPTGWLMAAVGQMLLFLGVVTLISSGMEQTINEVSWRIDHLAEEIHHLGIVVDDFEHEYRQERQLRRKHRPEDESARDAA